MSTFTDDDLEQLKEAKEKADKTPASEALTGTLTATKEALAYNQIIIKVMPALLARLEAAENVLAICEALRPNNPVVIESRLKAWRKACGI